MKALCFVIMSFIFIPCRSNIQESHLGEGWYPHDKKVLHAKIKTMENKAQQQYQAAVAPQSIKAIIVPHAGYSYSGTVATSVYRLLDRAAINRVIILAPDHKASFVGVALPSFDGYQTPLGVVNVDTAAVAQLQKTELFAENNTVFGREHSLEVQLPFIKNFLNDSVTVIPLIVGTITCDQAGTIAQALHSLIDVNTLIVVTTDFTHFGKQFNFTPFSKNIFHEIRRLDSQVVEHVQKGDCASFARFMNQSNATICGRSSLMVLLSLLQFKAFGAVEPRLIAYDSSGLQQNNTHHSVSYVGMLFTQEKLIDLPLEVQLTQQEKRGLLQEAHDILKNIFTQKAKQELLYPIKSFGVTRSLGAFTTLNTKTQTGKKLRGCIGRIVSPEPLYKTVATVTKDTALRDTRFTPVTQSEVLSLLLKLSILSQPHAIDSYNDIIIGKHGVILNRSGKSAVFLPEVPIEWKWNRETMLQHLSQKAGLPANAWQDTKTKFQVFVTLDIE